MADFIDNLADTTRILLRSGGNLQSMGGEERIKPDEILLRLKEQAIGHGADDSPDVDAAAAGLVKSAENALLKQGRGRTGDVTDEEFNALEIIVQVVGRPALRYHTGKVQGPGDLGGNERWTVLLSKFRQKIDAVSASVARLNVRRSDGSDLSLGTAWRIGDDLLVTNRHVVEVVVSNRTQSPDTWKLDPGRQYIAEFAFTDKPGTPQPFAVESLLYCATDLDAAVLRVSNAPGLPAALTPDFEPTRLGEPGPTGEFKGAEIYVVGHPERKVPTVEIQRVFGQADGRKRCSPGRAMDVSKATPQFRHDCSTLTGNSGSAIFTWDHHKVAGLHFGGAGADGARALGSANVAISFANLGQHPLGEILRTGRVEGSI